MEMEVWRRVNAINPLLIDDVIEILFEYLRLPDLKRCRLVCHAWCRNATKWLPTKCRQGVLFGDGKKQFNTFLKLAESSAYPAYLPHRKITLQSSILALNRSQSLETFFKICSSFLHSLFITYQDESHHYTGGGGGNAKDFDKILFTKSVQLPLLKHFHYEELPVANEDYYSYPPKRQRNALKGYLLFDKLLRASSDNLERLDLILQDTDLSKTEMHFMSLVNCSSKLGSLRRLRTLMLKLPLQDYHFELLRQAGLLSLTNIQLRFQNENSHSGPLRFFESCADSLQTISTNLWIPTCSYDNMFDESLKRFPCLPKVESLEISEWRTTHRNSDERRRDLPFIFSYKASFPNLRKLTLQSHSWEQCWNHFLPLQEVCYTLDELKLPKLLHDCRGIIIPKISTVFPRLKRLDLTVVPTSVDILSEVFCYLGRLEELSVNFLHDGIRYLNHFNNHGMIGGNVTSMCIDYVMTGIPERICKRIYSDDRIPKVKAELVESGYSIANLKYLKSLKLKNLSSVNYGIPQFTDITGYLGIMRLQKLCSLHIWRSQMSDECILDLQKHFKLFLHPNF